jgi:carbonic anhydrase
MANTRVGLSDNWLRQVDAVHIKHAALLDRCPTDEARHDRLSELNVLEQVVNVARTTVVQDAWGRGQPLHLHGWVYGLSDGLLRDLGITLSAPTEVTNAYQAALLTCASRASPGG